MPKTDDDSLAPVDLAQEYAEIGADKLVEASKQYLPILNDLGSEIPYIKTLIATIKAPRNISDFILGKKVHAFLYSSHLDQRKLDSFKRKFSKAKQERLWEQVLFAINAHDDKRKSEIIGKLFTALVDEEISENEFFTMVHATNSLNIHTLDELKNLYSLSFNTSLSASLYYSFATLGLIDIDNSSIGTIGGGGPRYPLNQTGWKYVGIVFDYPSSILKGIKIGKEELVTEFNKEGRPTGKSFPLKHIQSTGEGYREVDLFIVSNDGKILCDSKHKLPYIVGPKVVIAGETPEKAAQKISAQFKKEPLPIVTRNMEDAPIQRWAYVVNYNDQLDGTQLRSLADINVSISEIPQKTDYHRYINQVVEQIQRHTSGELTEHWNNYLSSNPKR